MSSAARLLLQETTDDAHTLEKNGVEVRINQVQMQRITGEVDVEATLMRKVLERANYARTIAVSLSQKGQGNLQGPIVVKSSNGKTLQMRISTNQRLMSRLANAAIPEGFDYSEYWFEISPDTPFVEIFPLTIEYETTNEEGEKCKFKFEKIFP